MLLVVVYAALQFLIMWWLSAFDMGALSAVLPVTTPTAGEAAIELGSGNHGGNGQGGDVAAAPAAVVAPQAADAAPAPEEAA
jgi:hypothetical protein